MTQGVYRKTFWICVLIELFFVYGTGSVVQKCGTKTYIDDDAETAGSWAETTGSLVDVMMLPLDVFKAICSHHYVIVMVFLAIDGVLRLADWLLQKPDAESANNTSNTGDRSDPRSLDQNAESSNGTVSSVHKREKPRKDAVIGESESGILPELRNSMNLNRHSQTPPFKSMSMTEADHRQKELEHVADTSRPVAIHYYYGKLIQVTSPHQVQIGDYNTMEVAMANSTDEESDGELSVTRDSDFDESTCHSGARSNSCSDLLDQSMTDDQKTRTLARSDSHTAGDTGSDSRRHSMDASFHGAAKENYRQSTGSLDTLNPALSEELFVEARFKIFKAAEEYRRSKLEEEASHQVPEKRKSKRFYFKKKT